MQLYRCDGEQLQAEAYTELSLCFYEWKFHIKGKIWDYWKISKFSSENTVGWLEEGSDGGTFLVTSCAN